MSNKTQLQTNNTNLDALIARVNVAKDTAASLPEASGGGNYEISTFTCDADVSMYGDCYENPFIVGMTWQEFINSPLNITKTTGLGDYPLLQSYSAEDNHIGVLNQQGFSCYLSIDGTAATLVSLTDNILNTQYKAYMVYSPYTLR